MYMAANVKSWTLDDLDALPDDGNRYEVIDGELFVTPAPAPEHEEIAVRLARLLEPFVAAHGLGYIYRPRAVVEVDGSRAEPDLMVRGPHPRPGDGWAAAPRPSLVIEIGSPYTQRRDREHKRKFYLDSVAVPNYWVVDPQRREILVLNPVGEAVVARDRVSWSPAGVDETLLVSLADVFGD